MSKLGTRDLKSLDKKVVKKEERSTQTEEEKTIGSSLGILDKLPAMERTQKELGSKRKKQLLNVNITRGVHDRCFRCEELEKKVKKLEKIGDQLRNQTKEYQVKLSNIRQIGKEVEEGLKKQNTIENKSGENYTVKEKGLGRRFKPGDQIVLIPTETKRSDDEENCQDMTIDGRSKKDSEEQQLQEKTREKVEGENKEEIERNEDEKRKIQERKQL